MRAKKEEGNWRLHLCPRRLKYTERQTKAALEVDIAILLLVSTASLQEEVQISADPQTAHSSCSQGHIPD